MTRNIFIFIGTFVVGALIALVARAALFNPHAGHEAHAGTRAEYSGMVSNPLVPANSGAGATSAKPTTPSTNAPSSQEHPNHGKSPTATSAKPVNSVCAICGMPVDPTIPTVEYQGKTIGFGCKMCPPKFKADPDLYGPLYLKNEPIAR